jgi:hypothetical protein
MRKIPTFFVGRFVVYRCRSCSGQLGKEFWRAKRGDLMF